MSSPADRARLAQIKSRVADSSTDWQLSASGDQLLAVIVQKTQPVAVVELTTDCLFTDRDFLLHAHDDMRFLVRLLKDAFDEIRRWKPAEQRKQETAHRKGDYAAECAMKCNDHLFRRFLSECKGVTDTTDAERIAVSVRRLLLVDKRSELNTDAGARNRWFDLRAEFDVWRREVA